MNEINSMERMAQTAATVASFLPGRVKNRIIQYEGNPPLPSGRWIEGAFMFADISGFTALSEKLASFGKVGAEEITRIINSFMDVMLVLVRHYDGDVIKFGGDALFIFFDGDGSADRALLCAKDMMTAIEKMTVLETDYGTFNFGMSLGLSYGRAFEAFLGNTDRIEYLITGNAVNELAMAEGAADKGEICGTKMLYQALTDNIVAERKGDFFLFSMAGGCGERAGEIAGGEKEDILLVLSSAPYLPTGVMDKIYTNPWQDKMEGEHRLATVMFCNFLGYGDLLALEDEKTITLGMQEYFSGQLEVIRKYDGNVNKLDIYDHGEKLMILFGVPAAHENDPERGLLCGLDMQKAISEIDIEGVAFKQKIGVNTGFLFSGNVGSSVRREYSVMGDAVNLSARLMGAADYGRVLTDERTAFKAKSTVITVAKEPIKVKGKEKPINISEVRGRKEKAERRVHSVYGREKEKESILAIIDRTLKDGRQLVSISGEAGMGKSALLSFLMGEAESKGWSSVLGECPSYGKNIPYLPVKSIMRELLGLSNNTEPTKVAEILTELLPQRSAYISLVGTVLGYNLEESLESASLDGDTRKKILHEMLILLIKNHLSQNPLVFIVENSQWADKSTMDFVDELARETGSEKLLICMVHRPELTLEQMKDFEFAHFVEIGEVGRKALSGIISDITAKGEISEEFIKLVGEKTQNNPLFIEEFVKTLKEKNALAICDGKWSIKGNLDELGIPDSVHGVIMARIDSLGEKPKQTLQKASVLGRTFPLPVLNGITEENSANELSLLEEHDLLLIEEREGEQSLFFKHILTQEIAYESLLFNNRKSLHCKAGSVIESIYSDNLVRQAEILAHHFTTGEAWEKSLPHLKVSGDKAKAIYSNDTALDYFSKYRNALTEKLPAKLETDAETRTAFLDVYLESGEILRLIDRMDEAEQLYDNLYDWSDKFNELKYKALSKNFIGQIYTSRGKFEESMKCLNSAFSLAEKAEDSLLKARVEFQMGLTEYTKQDFKKAREHYLKVVRETKKSSNTKLHCDALINLANAEMDSGNLDAIDYFLAAETIAREEHDKIRLTWILSNRGILEAKIGNTERAIMLLEEASEIAMETQNLRFAANCAVTLAGIYFDLEDFPKVEYFGNNALTIARKTGDAFTEGYSLMTIGRADMELGKLDSAKGFLLQSLDIAEKLGDKFTHSQDLIFLGHISVIEDVEKAREMIGRGIEIAETIGMKEIVAYGFYYEALSYDTQSSKAKSLFDEARSIAEQAGDIFLLKRLKNN